MSASQFTLPGEIWKDIPEYPGYQISNMGRARSFFRPIYGYGGIKFILEQTPQRILTPRINAMRYKRVRLYGKFPKSHHIHRLVLIAFVGYPPPNKISRHLDGNSLNNNLENLQWGTYKENSHDCCYVHGTLIMPKGEDHPCSKLTEHKIKQIRQLFAKGVKLASIARMFSIHRSYARKIVYHERWKHIK